MAPHGTATDGNHFDLLVSLQNHLGKVLAPYEAFMVGGKTYYLSPGGFLYRKDEEDPGSEEGRGHFCGYRDDEVWDHLETYLSRDSA